MTSYEIFIIVVMEAKDFSNIESIHLFIYLLCCLCSLVTNRGFVNKVVRRVAYCLFFFFTDDLFKQSRLRGDPLKGDISNK